MKKHFWSGWTPFPGVIGAKAKPCGVSPPATKPSRFSLSRWDVGDGTDDTALGDAHRVPAQGQIHLARTHHGLNHPVGFFHAFHTGKTVTRGQENTNTGNTGGKKIVAKIATAESGSRIWKAPMLLYRQVIISTVTCTSQSHDLNIWKHVVRILISLDTVPSKHITSSTILRTLNCQRYLLDFDTFALYMQEEWRV